MADIVKSLRGAYWKKNGEESDEPYKAADEIERLWAAEEAMKNLMGHVDTPIGRRRLGIIGEQPEWLTSARGALTRDPKENSNG